MQDGDRRRVIAKNTGRARAGRKIADELVGLRGDLRDGRLNLGAGMEIHADHGCAGVGLRLHVLDIVHRSGHAALTTRGDHVGHVVGSKAAVAPHHADDGNVDFRKDVGRHARDGQASRQQDRQRHHYKSVGTAQRQSNNPHTILLNSAAANSVYC